MIQCAECDGVMETFSSDDGGSIRVDRCLDCKGLHFDQLTLSDLALVEGKQNMDSGDAELGAEYDDMVYVECPKCDKIMEQCKTEEPVEIRFEHCPSRYATFLDAAELKQYLDDDHRAEFTALLPA
ncbi:MAG: Zn-finger nucleic acid-binding protein [Patiriisocius sp.]